MDRDYQRISFECEERQRRILAEQKKFDLAMEAFQSGLKLVIQQQAELDKLFILGKI